MFTPFKVTDLIVQRSIYFRNPQSCSLRVGVLHVLEVLQQVN